MLSVAGSGASAVLANSQAPPATVSGPQVRGAETTRRQDLGPDPDLAELKARDREVRAHEQAHATVGGRYAGAPIYSYERGPDGVMYAVGGKVNIDAAPVANDPQATIEKMQIVER